MSSYKHKKLIERIKAVDEAPNDTDAYAAWLDANGHLDLLRDNAEEDELIVHASGDYTFVITAVVNRNRLNPLDQTDLLNWSCNISDPSASYTWGGGRDDVWIERADYFRGSKILKDAQKLVFPRSFEAVQGKYEAYYEILQEYLHLAEIHWRQEQHAYCRFDDNGDFEHIVSVTYKENKRDVTLISFKREPLELYLAASNSVLLRMFDFILLRRGKDFEFTHWPDEPEKIFNKNNDFFYRQKIDPGKAAYTRGVQIVGPSRPSHEIFSCLKDGYLRQKKGEYAEFVAHDCRNNRITKISTDPTATTNFFEADENSLPFELSPAFFRPDVLLKYKGDSEKYAVSERDIHCRGAWTLRGYDVNEAGQVHAYICDLRDLPYQEQLYWQSHNEEPKAGISERAIANDFKAEPTDPDSLQNVLLILREWAETDLAWWTLREEALLERISIPRTNSRDEWSAAFKALSKLIIEGFEIKVIRGKLEEMNIIYDGEKEKSISLLEKLLVGQGKINSSKKLLGIRKVQHIRSKFSHSGSGKVEDLAKNALQEHGTYAEHFKSVCSTVADELKLIEQAIP